MSRGEIVFEGEIPSSSLGKPRRIHIYVPPGYNSPAAKRKRYPVLYVHDGQNAFSTAGAHAAFGWGAWDLDKTADRLIAENKIQPIIIVAIDCSEKRYQEYRGPKEWLKSRGNDDLYQKYARFLIDELKPKIDRDYRSKKTAKDTALIGSSMGGVASLALAWEHPDVFGKIASLSGAFQVEDKAALKFLKKYSAKPKPIRIFLDSGTIDMWGGDDGLSDTQAVADQLRRIGWKKDLVQHIDSGLTEAEIRSHHLNDQKTAEAIKSHHNEFYWRVRSPRALKFLFPLKAP
jgi:enterochelin esterase-like enzyme